MEKKFDIGFYGGKFMPMHIGHDSCIKKASEECKTAYLIMFINGTDENRINKTMQENFLTIEERVKQIERVAAKYNNVIPAVINVASCKTLDGKEDWDAETPLVRAVCGPKIDAIYGSEPQYAEYFARAYPEATYRILDPDRTMLNISATAIRNMKDEKERKKWMV